MNETFYLVVWKAKTESGKPVTADSTFTASRPISSPEFFETARKAWHDNAAEQIKIRGETMADGSFELVSVNKLN